VDESVGPKLVNKPPGCCCVQQACDRYDKIRTEQEEIRLHPDFCITFLSISR